MSRKLSSSRSTSELPFRRLTETVQQFANNAHLLNNMITQHRRIVVTVLLDLSQIKVGSIIYYWNSHRTQNWHDFVSGKGHSCHLQTNFCNGPSILLLSFSNISWKKKVQLHTQVTYFVFICKQQTLNKCHMYYSLKNCKKKARKTVVMVSSEPS